MLALTVFFFIFSSLLIPSNARAVLESPLGLEWMFTKKGQLYSPPIAKNLMVYIGTDNGVLYVLKGFTGKQKWRYHTHEDIRCSPAVENGLVYLGLNNGSLIALDAFTGEERWFYEEKTSGPLPTEFVYYYAPTPAVMGDTVVHSSPGGKVNAFDAETGSLKWSHSTKSFFASAPIAANGMVYVSSIDGKLQALDIDYGEIIWSYDNLISCDCSPAVGGDMVFQGSADGKIYAFDAKSGRIIWRHHSLEVAKCIIVGKNMVYFGSSNGNLHALDIDTGQLKWRFITEGSVLSTPTFDDGLIYLGSNDGKLYVIDAYTGDLQWVYDTKGFFVTSTATAHEMYYVGATTKEDGFPTIVVTAFKKGSFPGTEIWVEGRKEETFATWLINYISSGTRGVLRGKELSMHRILDIASYPLGFPVHLMGRASTEFVESWELHHCGRINKMFIELTSLISVSGYISSLVLTPLNAGASISFLIYTWIMAMLLSVLYFQAKGLLFAGVFVNNNTSRMRTYLKKLFISIIPNYPLILIYFLMIGAGLFACALLTGLLSYLPRFWFFVLLGLSLWVLTILIGSLGRGLGLALYNSREEKIPLRLIGALKETKGCFGRLIVFSLWHFFLLILISLGLSMGQARGSYPMIIGGFIGTIIFVLTVFMDASVVLEGRGLPDALQASIHFSLRNLPWVIIYLTLVGLILLLISIPLNFLRSWMGMMISVSLSSLICAFLVQIHALFYLSWGRKVEQG